MLPPLGLCARAAWPLQAQYLVSHSPKESKCAHQFLALKVPAQAWQSKQQGSSHGLHAALAAGQRGGCKEPRAAASAALRTFATALQRSRSAPRGMHRTRAALAAPLAHLQPVPLELGNASQLRAACLLLACFQLKEWLRHSGAMWATRLGSSRHVNCWRGKTKKN